MTCLIAMPAIDPAAGEALPELPALTQLLQRATRLPPASDWRGGVLDALGLSAAGVAQPARVAAQAVPGLEPGTGLCLATPVHVIAGISRMFLAQAGSFELSADEQEALRLAFNAEFGAAAHLHAVGSGWLLQAPFAAAAMDADPECLGGAALKREPATTPAARLLRRLGAEVEMWLAALPLNKARETRGAPPINCFWFWSGMQTSVLPLPARNPTGLFSNLPADAWLAGLATHCNRPVVQVSGWEDLPSTTDALAILQPSQPGAVARLLPAWEAAWFTPVWLALASRQLPALRLQIGRSAWQLPAPRLTRWLRRAQPWWQAVSA